ncbi:MAG: winged helix-turn-helix domain-containing protein [Acidobacteriota bacterium]
MISSKYLTMGWDELIEEARRGLKESDVETLRQLDAAFHHFFLNEARRGDEKSKTRFIMGILGVLHLSEARAVEPASEIQQFLCRWSHLDGLMDVLRREGGLAERAERFINSRKHADRLLEAAARAGARGIAAGELASELGISQQHLSKLLREMESRDIIERHSEGGKVYVCLGLVGEILVEERQQTDQEKKLSRATSAEGSQTGWEFSGGSPSECPIDSSPRVMLAPGIQ